MNQNAIDTAEMLRPDLYKIKNLFDQAVLNDLLTQLDQETQWELQTLQEKLPRRTLSWVNDGTVDRIWCMLNALDFSRFNFKFANVSIWKDLPGYCIGNHVDNPGVEAAMQIYLSDLPKELGTWFDDIEIPYVQNSGYVMNNQHQPVHGMRHAVPPGHVRYSLYARFNCN